MSLLEEIKKLQELEQKATAGKWYKAERDEGDCDEINGRTQSWDTGVMVYDREMGVFHPEMMKVRSGPEEYEDDVVLESICAPDKEQNADFIVQNRNLAQAMLSVLECFRGGDAEAIQEIIDGLRYAMERAVPIDPGNMEPLLKRLQKAASLMEGQ